MLFPLLLLITFGMSGALVVPLLLVEEKEKRTLDFLLTSPASLTEIVTGKALTGVVYSALIAGVLLAINHKLIGNWPLTLLTLLLGTVLRCRNWIVHGKPFSKHHASQHLGQPGAHGSAGAELPDAWSAGRSGDSVAFDSNLLFCRGAEVVVGRNCIR